MWQFEDTDTEKTMVKRSRNTQNYRYEVSFGKAAMVVSKEGANTVIAEEKYNCSLNVF